MDVTTEDDDDSDEDFKGDSSATEVDEGSDEEFVDDMSTAEEVSDDSDFKYNRRKSTRNARKSSKKSKRSRAGKRIGKRGYRRDEFVVSSDESDAEYRPGGSRVRTRAVARKKISYCEETSEDESEDDYYYKPTNNKNKRQTKSESSDEEWGRKKSSEDKESKKFWVDDDDEEEEDEEEDQEDNEDDGNEDEEVEDENPVYKPGPKSSKVSDRILMKGKPRLSKAKELLNLKEESDDEDLDDSQKSKKNKKSKKFNKLSDSENEEQVSENEVKNVSEKSDSNIVIENKTKVNEEIKVNSSETMIAIQNSVKESELQNTSSQPIPENLTNNESLNDNEILKLSANINPLIAPQIVDPIDSPQLTQSVNIPQLTHNSNNYPQLDQHLNKSQNVLTDNNVKENSVEEYYSLTSLDSYPTSRPPPLKPTVVSDQYPQSLSPPRILTLESNAYSRHPSHEYPSHHSLPPKGLIEARLERPFMSGPRMPTPFGGQSVAVLRNELRSGPVPSSAHNFGPHNRPQYYPQSQPPPPYYPRPHPRQTTPFTGPHLRPQTGSPIPPRTTTPITSSPNYRPSGSGPWNHSSINPTPSQGYAFSGPPPGYYPPPQSQQSSGHGLPLPPSYPASYPPNYAYFSPNSGTAANGAFMIHNLLQHRTHNPEDNIQTPITETPNGGQELRTSNESFTTYMTQE